MEKRYAIVHRPDAKSKEFATKLEQYLRTNGWQPDEGQETLVLIIGGDGTFLHAVDAYMSRIEKVTFYGIHTGTLGFFADYTGKEFDAWIQSIQTEHMREVNYPLIQAQVGEETYYALNEVRIENVIRTQELDVCLNGDHLETYRGTGMLVCSQLGSTAYNRSLGGAVVQEGFNMLQLVEIAGIHHREYLSLGSPLIVKPDTRIRFFSPNMKGAVLGVDAKVYPLDDQTCVQITQSEKCVRVFKSTQVSYFDRLRALF